MSAARRSYDVHGVGVTVVTADPAVADAMDLRLRAFPAVADLDDAVSLEFVPPNGRPSSPGAAGRPVYETPFGDLLYDPGSDTIHGELDGVQLSCSASAGSAVFTCEAFAGRPLYLATHPLATISLMEILERRGLHALHAGCVATDGGLGILLAGPSGAGKSTLTFALAQAGMRFLSDDTVFLRREPAGDVRVLGFSDAIGVTEQTAERFAELRPLLADDAADGFPKRLRRIEDVFAAPPLASCSPQALVFPEIVRDEPSFVTPLDAGEALLRLVPDALLTEPGSTQRHLEAFAALLEQVRCYRVASGPDLRATADLVRALV